MHYLGLLYKILHTGWVIQAEIYSLAIPAPKLKTMLPLGLGMLPLGLGLHCPSQWEPSVLALAGCYSTPISTPVFSPCTTSLIQLYWINIHPIPV